jgi:hypothetical protein
VLVQSITVISQIETIPAGNIEEEETESADEADDEKIIKII